MQVEVVNKKQARRRAGIWIDRRSVLGNPFRVDRTRGDKEAAHREVCEQYHAWLRQQWKLDGPVKAELLRLLALATEPEVVATRAGDSKHLHQHAEQHTLTLLCWCKPFPCHGDVIIEALRGIRAQQLARQKEC